MTDHHRIEIDEAGDGQGPDYGYAAFCDCGWSQGQWSHSDAMPSYDHHDPLSIEVARDEAYAEAEALGAAHLGRPRGGSVTEDDRITVTLDWDTSVDPATAHWTLTEEQAERLEAWLNANVGPVDGFS